MAEEITVDTTSAAYDEMTHVWDMTNALLGGTRIMRQAGEKYLPRFAAEDKVNYQSRVKRSFLTNYFKRALRHLAAKPFGVEATVEDLPSQLEPLMFDADMTGNSFHVFAHRVFSQGLAKGMSHILVDYPDAPAEGETLADERLANRRPYLVNISPENLIAAHAEIIDGREILTHVRIRENETVRVGFGETVIQRVRVLEPGTWEIWELGKENRKEEWTVVGSGTTSLDFIPLVTFYAGRLDFMLADPPLYDLGFLNVAHWQSASDQRNILTVARFPMLAATGVDTQSVDSPTNSPEIKIGPFQVLRAQNSEARFYFVEHAGEAVLSGRQDLEDLREQMAILSAESMLRTRTGNVTATQRAIDKAEADSMLEQFVIDLEDTLDNALRYANAWLGNPLTDDAGSTKLSRDFSRTAATEADVRDLIKLRMAGELSRDTLFREMIRRGVLAEDFDLENEFEKADAEESALPELTGVSVSF
tara:strand:- start:1220 stop:2650 length:1431 start_codon:yes stop_codon:yes gene_type:complete